MHDSDERGETRSAREARVLEAGARFGDYRIVQRIGAGGMGEVYRARDEKLDRDVALKLLPPELTSDESRRARFEAEARAMASVAHPNVVALYGVGSEDGVPYVVTELLLGRTLHAELRESGAMPPSRVVAIAIQIARALAAVHERGVIHCDLKPSNIFLIDDDHVKILDFGLARLLAPSWQPPADDDDTPSFPAEIFGSPGFMAPEQVEGRPVDFRADIFSFGAVLYEMLYGEPAFKGPTQVETMYAVLRHRPARLGTGASGVPAIESIIERCLEKQPSKRFDSTRDLGFALKNQREQSPATPDSGAAGWRRAWKRHRPAGWVVSFALAGLVITALSASDPLDLVGGRPGESQLSPMPAVRLTRLTTSGDISSAVLLSGAKLAVCSVETDAGWEIRLRHLASGSESVVVAAAPAIRFVQCLSPDEEIVYFVEWDREARRTVWKVPVLGGAPTLIAEANVRAWVVGGAPDGSAIAVGTDEDDPSLILMDPLGRNRRVLARLVGAGTLLGPLAWSPESRSILVSSETRGVLIVDARSGREQELRLPEGMRARSALWNGDGSAIILTTFDGDVVQLSWPDGRVSKQLSRSGKYEAWQLVDGRALLIAQRAMSSHLWTFDTVTKESRQLSFGVEVRDGIRGVGWTVNGAILYTLATATGPDGAIWLRSEDGSVRRRLTTPPASARDCNPKATADGLYVVFDRYDKASPNPYSIRRIPAAGGEETVLLEDDQPLWNPALTGDSRHVFFWRGALPGGWTPGVDPPPESWRMSIDGLNPERIAGNCGFLDVNASGSKILCTDDKRTRLLDVASGRSVPVTDPDPPALFAPDGSITYILPPTATAPRGRSNVVTVVPGETEERRLTNFNEHRVLIWAWTADGRKMLVVRFQKSIDLFLMDRLP